MIRKLRNKIIVINVVLMSIILLTALITIFTIGYSRIRKEGDTRMNMALSYDILSDDDYCEVEAFNDIVLVIYDKNTKQVVEYFCAAANVLDKNAVTKKVIDEIAEGERSEGFVMSLHSNFKKTEADENTVRIAFMDISAQQNSVGTYAAFATMTAIISLASYFVISYLLAHIALKPVEDSWTQQKQFIADASHELKTPLSVIMANTEIISSHPEETVASQMKWIENTKSESRRMADLVANLLFIAKNDDGLKVQMEEVDFSDCVGKMVLGYDAIFYENGKQFDYDIPLGITVTGNEGQLKQLVTILLDNANKYSLGVGNIQLRLSAAGKHAVLTVSNDSATLSDEQLAHLFDRFYTVDPSRNKNTGGNGLGLSIAKIVCETHGGKISVASENGRTAFTATIPLLKNKKNDEEKQG